MKVAPVMREMQGYPGEIRQSLIHTGQHYDRNISEVFFEELELPKPDLNLNVGSGSHAFQTAQVMLGFEKALLEFRPNWVCVPGDVNSALACALVATKLGVRVAHIEAGLRSFDRTMPEEINRLLIDQISDLLFTPSADADQNLVREGIPVAKIRRVGNVMIDSVVRLLPKARARWQRLRTELGLDHFLLVTLHRPANVDELDALLEIMSCLTLLAQRIRIVFPLHPRTRKRLSDARWKNNQSGLSLTDPLGYLDFLALEERAALVITDSGGVQEETTFLGTPCLTVRPSTERPITLKEGTNELVGRDSASIASAVHRRLAKPRIEYCAPELWDGSSAQRIVEIFRSLP
jgi:UDP-N-acetylglucosamine 2-epimerase (non-hydrolysing)